MFYYAHVFSEICTMPLMPLMPLVWNDFETFHTHTHTPQGTF